MHINYDAVSVSRSFSKYYFPESFILYFEKLSQLHLCPKLHQMSIKLVICPTSTQKQLPYILYCILCYYFILNSRLFSNAWYGTAFKVSI